MTNYLAMSTPRAEELTFYQMLYRRSVQGSEALRTLYRQRKNKESVTALALWEGSWNLKHQATDYVEKAQRRGQLLTMFCDF